MMLHLLDTSAHSILAAPHNAGVRHRLIPQVDAGSIVVLVTRPLLRELPGTRAVNQAHYDNMMDLLYRITQRRLLLSVPPRLEKEVRKGGPLVFPEYVDDEHVLEPPRDADEIDTAAARYAGESAGLTFHEMERATDTVDTLEEEARRQARVQGQPYDPVSWRRGLREAFKQEAYVLDHAEHHARKDMHDVSAEIGVDVTSLEPRNLPTAWGRAVVHVARIRAVVLGKTSPKGKKSPGALDLAHLKEAAAYADVFVTHDGSLRAFAEQVVPALRCEVLSFDEWAARI
jgi:hypothetical protein